MTAPCPQADAGTAGTGSPAEVGIDLRKYREINRYAFPRTGGDTASERRQTANCGEFHSVLRIRHKSYIYITKVTILSDWMYRHCNPGKVIRVGGRTFAIGGALINWISQYKRIAT